MYGILSFCFLYPSSDMQQTLRDGSLVSQLKEVSKALPYWSEIREDVVRFISILTEQVSKTPSEDLQKEYDILFGQAQELTCPPYETSYNGEHVFAATRTLADIAGFYKAFGLSTAGTWHDMVDHVAVELEFVHFLTFKEAHAMACGKRAEWELMGDAAKKFLEHHVLRWVGSFAENLRKVSKLSYYASLGELTKKFIVLEGGDLGVTDIRLNLKPGETRPLDGFTCGAQCGL